MVHNQLLRGLFVVTLFSWPAFQARADTSTTLVNPGFEQGLDGWTLEGWRLGKEEVVCRIDPAAPRSGEQSASLHHLQSNDTALVQRLRVEPQAVYRISGWIKTDQVVSSQGSIGASLSIHGTWVHSADVQGTQDWQLLTLWIRTGSAQREIALACRLGYWNHTVTGTAWCDDLAIERVTDIPAGVAVQPLGRLAGHRGLFHRRSWSYWAAIAGLLLAIVCLWRCKESGTHDY